MARSINTFVLNVLIVSIAAGTYWLDALLEPTVASRFEVLGLLLIFGFICGSLGWLATALIGRWFEHIREDSRVFLAVSVPVSLAVMVILGATLWWYLTAIT